MRITTWQYADYLYVKEKINSVRIDHSSFSVILNDMRNTNIKSLKFWFSFYNEELKTLRERVKELDSI